MKENPFRDKAGWIHFLIFWGLSLLCDWPLFREFIVSGITLANLTLPLVAVHGLGAVMWIFYQPMSGSLLRTKRHWSRVFMFIAAYLPGLGHLIILAIFITFKKGTEIHYHIEEGEFLGPQDFLVPSKVLVPLKREDILHELDLIPLADIMASNNEELKRGAIERLAELKTPETIGLLMQYRSDPSAEIRFYITSVLSRIKNDFDEQLEAAKRQMQRDVYKVSARVFLAKCYVDYIKSTLLDEATCRAYNKEALYHLTYSLSTEYASKEAYLLLVDLFFSDERWDEALAVVDQYLAQKDSLDIDFLKKRTLLYFYKKDMSRFSAGLKQCLASGCQDSSWVAAAQWWGG